jgi:hypothetical protein
MKRRTTARGLTLAELVTVMAVASVVVLIVSTLLVASQRQWVKTYAYANSGIEADAVQTMITYGIMGRKSNKVDYVVYKAVNGAYAKVLPPADAPESLVTGDAVEFRYWDTDFDSSMLDPKKTATAYAFFYLDGKTLKVDEGPYDSTTHIGAINNGLRVTGNQVGTITLSTRVTSLVFSHNTTNAAGDGDGVVRMEVTFSEPTSHDTLTIKTSTLLRNVWPS